MFNGQLKENHIIHTSATILTYQVEGVVAQKCNFGFGAGHKLIFFQSWKLYFMYFEHKFYFQMIMPLNDLKWLFQGEHVREYGSLWSKHLDTFFWTDGVIQKAETMAHANQWRAAVSRLVFSWSDSKAPNSKTHCSLKMRSSRNMQLPPSAKLVHDQVSSWPAELKCTPVTGAWQNLEKQPFSIPFQPHEGGGWRSLPPPGIQEPKHPPATVMVQMQLWN